MPVEVVSPIMDRLALIAESVDGINSAIAGRPRDIASPNLPCIVVTSGESDYDWVDVGMPEIIAIPRTYHLVLLVKSWYEGIELEAEELVRPFYTALISAFTGIPGLNHPKGLNPLPSVQDARLVGDSGTINIELAGVVYAGVDFRILVTEYFPVTYT